LQGKQEPHASEQSGKADPVGYSSILMSFFAPFYKQKLFIDNY